MRNNKEMTVPVEVFEFWKKWRRFKDIRVLEKYTGYSQPLITRALNYGNCTNDELVKAITKFYKERSKEELKMIS